MSQKALVKAVSHFCSETMERHLESFDDETDVRLEVSGRNGYGLTLKLRHLRQLWKAQEQATKENVYKCADCQWLFPDNVCNKTGFARFPRDPICMLFETESSMSRTS